MADTKTAPVEETKAAKFTRLAETRVTKALNAIAIIGGLAAKNNYEYTEAQVAAIKTALDAEITVLMNRFAKPDSVAAGGFKFS